MRAADPAEQAKVIDTYVRSGVYAVNEARALLGLDPVSGGHAPMVYGAQGAVPFGGGTRMPLGKAGFNPAEPRIPKGETGSGEWTSSGSESSVASGSEPPDNGSYQPGGTIITPIEGEDPLDPKRLNTAPTPEEQKRIADTVTAIQQDDVAGLQPHSYRNLPRYKQVRYSRQAPMDIRCTM